MTAKNVLIIVSDQHQRNAAGCYGHSFVQTPNLDSLASRGTRFSNAYTNSPMCVPARSALATGRPVFETGYWDHVHAYDGRVKSWHHWLAENGLGATSIGKLHFRSAKDPTGFENQIIPLHIVDGVGDLRSAVKRPLAPPFKHWKGIERLGPGESTYTKYDAQITEKTCAWIRAKSKQSTDKPWVLFSSFVCPHPPYSAPKVYYDLYASKPMSKPKFNSSNVELHPWMQKLQRCRNYDDFVDAETSQRIMANYFGCVTYMDVNLGTIIDCLDDCGMRDDTLIIYTSDHGENLGSRKIWGKMNMYEESVAIPMIIAGPDIPEGSVNTTAVTLLDVAPTVLHATGLAGVARSQKLTGKDLGGIARKGDDSDRVAFSEYYAAGADRAAFMIRKGRYKYIHYVGYEPELFDLKNDPEELNSLNDDPAHRHVLESLEAVLRQIVNPEEADERAYRDQCAVVEIHGGRDALIEKGGFQGTPIPGEKPVYTT